MLDLPPPGFRGLDPAKAVTIRRRHLPHWRQEGASYFVTFRLADSLPGYRIRQLHDDRTVWLKAHPVPTEADWDRFARQAFVKLETWLHERQGACLLGDDQNASFVLESLRYFDGSRCLLGCSVVMPNHVHVVVCPACGHELDDLMQSCKRFSASRINRRLKRAGESVWQAEFFDRIVRDTDHLRRCVRYVEKNAAGVQRPAPFWLREDWREWYYGPGKGM